MSVKSINLWDVATFDLELVAFLKESADLIRDYVKAEQHIFLTYDRGGPSRASHHLRPENSYARAYLQLQEDVADAMQRRTIRAYHYTRLTENEVETMKRDGIHLSTPATLRGRLNACVASSLLTQAEADALYAASPFHQQMTNRANRFWLTSHPLPINDLGVQPLLDHWGGEVTYMWLEDEDLIAKVQAIGKPRIIEADVPLNSTTVSYNAASSVLATFARSLGCVTAKHAIDISVTVPLPPDSILTVHTDGQPAFTTMGRGYPEGFVDVDLTYWKDLTGED